MSSLVVGVLPCVSRQMLCNGISSITSGIVIPPLLGRRCLVDVKQGVPREGKFGGWIGQATWVAVLRLAPFATTVTTVTTLFMHSTLVCSQIICSLGVAVWISSLPVLNALQEDYKLRSPDTDLRTTDNPHEGCGPHGEIH